MPGNRPHPELVRLLALLETYDVALSELAGYADSALEPLMAELEALRARAALDAFSNYDAAAIEDARAGLSRDGAGPASPA